jgi:hypothetical protein
MYKTAIIKPWKTKSFALLTFSIWMYIWLPYNVERQQVSLNLIHVKGRSSKLLTKVSVSLESRTGKGGNVIFGGNPNLMVERIVGGGDFSLSCNYFLRENDVTFLPNEPVIYECFFFNF